MQMTDVNKAWMSQGSVKSRQNLTVVIQLNPGRDNMHPGYFLKVRELQASSEGAVTITAKEFKN